MAAATTHHLLLGHGLATAALRASRARASEVGITLNLTPIRVAADANGSAEALERARLVADASQNGLFLDPILFGRYPAAAPASMLPPAELILDGDMETIAAPLDFLGVNYYQPVHLKAGDPANLRRGESAPMEGIEGSVVEYRPDHLEQTNMGWLIDPDGLYELLLRVSKDAQGLPLYITENGCAAEDYINPDGVVNDLERIKFLHLHLDACARAIRDGATLAGYYVWSLLDNFEWALRLPEAVRHRVRGLRHPAADPQGQLGVLRPGGAAERGARAAGRLAGLRTTSRPSRRVVKHPGFRARFFATTTHHQPATPSSALGPVGYAIDVAHWCRWRSRPVRNLDWDRRRQRFLLLSAGRRRRQQPWRHDSSKHSDISVSAVIMITKGFITAKTFRAQSTNFFRPDKSLRDLAPGAKRWSA